MAYQLTDRCSRVLLAVQNGKSGWVG